MQELSGVAKQLKNNGIEENAKGYLWGIGIEKLIDTVLGKAKELIGTSLELAESADGVAHAFNAIDQHDDILKNLRTATKGTVNDFELMKAAVQAKDFRIPLEDLGNYLAFAQLKAQQTGQSVEDMTNSIVTGLGRQSKQILDNLGISASEIDEKVAETGDFMKAVASIVENQLSQAGETYISSADRALRKTTDLQNAQLAMGQALLPWKEAVDTGIRRIPTQHCEGHHLVGKSPQVHGGGNCSRLCLLHRSHCAQCKHPKLYLADKTRPGCHHSLADSSDHFPWHILAHDSCSQRIHWQHHPRRGCHEVLQHHLQSQCLYGSCHGYHRCRSCRVISVMLKAGIQVSTDWQKG